MTTDLFKIEPSRAPELERARRDYEAACELVDEMMADDISTENQILNAMHEREGLKTIVARLESSALRKEAK